uniref:Uncharacterized protein n=1 Tax=Ditylenchus dipsaci TaxID=166011 RepID=A0A915DZG5_9BILA
MRDFILFCSDACFFSFNLHDAACGLRLLAVCVFAEDMDSMPKILLKKGSPKSITQAIVAPSRDKIYFTIMPLDCTTEDIINKVKYSYSDGCNMDLIWKLDVYFTHIKRVALLMPWRLRS